MPKTPTKKTTSKSRTPKNRSLPKSILASGEAIQVLAEAGEQADPNKPVRFKMVAYNGGAMLPRGFDYPVVLQLSGWSVARAEMPVYRQHDSDRIVGHTVDATINQSTKTIEANAIASGVGDDANEFRQTARNKFPWQSSIGASVNEGALQFFDKGETFRANGQTFTGPKYLAASGVIHEISVVPIGGDETTSATVTAAAADQENAMKFSEWLSAAGFDEKTITDKQKPILQAAFEAEHPSDKKDEGGADIEAGKGGQVFDIKAAQEAAVKEIRTSAAAESTRVAGIQKVCAEYGNPQSKVNGKDVVLQAHAIEQNWTVEQTELQALRDSRHAAPAAHVSSHEKTATLQAMQGALLLRCGLPLDHKSYASLEAIQAELPTWMRKPLNDDTRQRYMEAAHQFSDMSLLDLCAEAVRLDAKGGSMPRGRQNIIKAAVSGGTLNDIFTTNMNAIMLVTFAAAKDTTRGWVREADVTNFQTQERHRMERGGMKLKELPRGKTAEHGERSSDVESYKIKRFARKNVIDEQDIIDNSLQALKDNPIEMMKAAADLRPDLVYSILLSNPNLSDSVALFSDTRDNLLGSNTLGEPGLKAAIAAMRLFRENGATLNLTPSHILVPPELEFTADGLISSSETRAAAANGGPTKNTLQGKVRTSVSEARLSNGVEDPVSGTTHSGSASNWFLVSDEYPPIEVGTLQGTGGMPSVRSFTLSEGAYGLGWDIKLDIGAKAIQWRSIIKNA